MRRRPSLPQAREAVRGRGGVVLVLDVLRRRPEHDVAEHGGRDQHALRRGGRHGQQHVPDQPATQLVEDDQLSAARHDGEAAAAGHAVDLVGAQAGGVHHPAAREPARGRIDRPGVTPPRETGHPLAPAKRRAGQHRLGGEGERRRPGADDELVRDLERPERPPAQGGLAAVQLLDRDLGDAAVSARLRVRPDGREAVELLSAPRDEQRAGALHRHADLVRVGEEQIVAARDEPRLERPRLGVEARVEDRRVGLARAGPHVAGVDQRDAQVEPCELSRDRSAHHPGADDGDVEIGAHDVARESPTSASAASRKRAR